VRVWDALTPDRPYQKAMSRDEAIAQMAQCRGHWRGAVYDAFCRAIARAPGSGKGEERSEKGRTGSGLLP
jgi:HD-GYP domain-containing protein (c-di-GMP phosphodiesterase class II)